MGRQKATGVSPQHGRAWLLLAVSDRQRPADERFTLTVKKPTFAYHITL